jgi:hypothetical protein
MAQESFETRVFALTVRDYAAYAFSATIAPCSM